jgi:DNA-3-methyladenine glycosylase
METQGKILQRSFYQRDTVSVAHDLLGKILISGLGLHQVIGIISETEAYRSDDEASHAFRGETARNKALFGPVGHSYVYLSYGLHYCLNVVARDTHNYAAGGVLIRGLIPAESVEGALNNPFKDYKQKIHGPGNVGKFLHVALKDNGIDLTNAHSPLCVFQGPALENSFIHVSPRIGISKAVELPWRFFIKYP